MVGRITKCNSRNVKSGRGGLSPQISQACRADIAAFDACGGDTHISPNDSPIFE